MPVGVIILAAAHVPDVVDHPGGPIRYMLDQPFMEQILDLVGQAQQHIARTGRAMIGGGFQQVYRLPLHYPLGHPIKLGVAYGVLQLVRPAGRPHGGLIKTEN